MDKMYDSQWRLVPGKVKNYHLSNGTMNMMPFTANELNDHQYVLGPGVRERLPERFNHCWVIATHDSPEQHRGRIRIAIKYSFTKVVLQLCDRTYAKVPLTMVRAARPNWSDCARCFKEHLYMVIDENLSDYSTIG